MTKLLQIIEMLWMLLLTLLYLLLVAILGLFCLLFTKNSIYSKKKSQYLKKSNKPRDPVFL